MKTITTNKAIDKAMALFNCAGLGDIRAVELYEGSGSGSKWTSIDIRVHYSKNGDYTESDKNPFIAHVEIHGDGVVIVNKR